MLPTFLGIGAPRAGTTWLHEVLASHPQAFTPTERKEIQFFDRYYDRGIEWYESFFPPERGHYEAVGEVSPMYLAHPDAPARIARLGSVDRLIVQLRNPVDRAYSEYLWRVNRGAYRGTIQEFCTEKPRLLAASHYSEGLTRYLELFDRSQLLTLVFEETFQKPADALDTIGAFLGIDPGGFDPAVASHVSNPSTVVHSLRLSRFAHRIGGSLRSRGWDRLVNRARDSTIGHFMTSGQQAVPALSPADRAYLSEMFSDERPRLEALLNIDLASWDRIDI